jgi:hypothetical protein
MGTKFWMRLLWSTVQVIWIFCAAVLGDIPEVNCWTGFWLIFWLVEY